MTLVYSICLVAGARPNFMKVAPIVHALEKRKEASRAAGIELRFSIVHTGQHYDANMSDVFFRDLEIPAPDRHLEVGSGSHAEQTAKIMVAFEKVLLEDRPNLVVVVGDVTEPVRQKRVNYCAEKKECGHQIEGLLFDAVLENVP